MRDSKGKEKKSVFEKKLDYLFYAVLASVFFVFALLGVFRKIDYRFYDIFLKFRKEPAQSENILHVNIDNESISDLGEWPWTRDVYADMLIQMKELGAERAVFDIEYLSPSKKGTASEEEAIPNINSVFESRSNEIIESIYLLGDRISNGDYKASEAGGLADSIVSDVVHPAIDGIYDSVMMNAFRDNDEYFARALQFFGNAWLTVNTRNVNEPSSDEDIEYIDNRFLLKNVSDSKDFISKANEFTSKEQYKGEESGFCPALHTLLSRTKGVGFTNVIVDKDGTRRRAELLFNHGGNYLGQLTFAPLLDFLDVQSLERKRSSLVMRGAKYPGSDVRENVKIPLDDNGRMLINWLHSDFGSSFRHESAYYLVKLKKIEDNIFTNLQNIIFWPVIDIQGNYLTFWNEAAELFDYNSEIRDMKNHLLSLCTGFDGNDNAYDGIRPEMYEDYFAMKKDFYSRVKEYSSRDFLDEVRLCLEELKSNNLADDDSAEDFYSSLENIFYELKRDIEAYLHDFEEMKAIYNNSFCILGNTASSTTDIGANPFNELYCNVGTHANVLNTILQKDFIVPVSWHYGFFAAMLLVLLAMLFSHRYSNSVQNIVNGAALFLVLVTPVFLMIFASVYIPFTSFWIFAFLNFIAGLAYRFFLSSKEKRFITQLAASFANKDTVESLRKNPEAFKTEGQKKNITALFSDIQKFSTFSENMSLIYGDEGPNRLIENLNEYLGAMSNEILKNNGTIDKYEGDAIISMFGAPDPMMSRNPDEWAYLCLDSAIKMKKVEKLFNESHSGLFRKYTIGGKEIELKPFQTRIGINSGEAFVGLMGSKTDEFSKLNYTMIGDTVNLASRLEGVNKAYGTWIMCSDATWTSADKGENKGKIVVKRLDKVRVVGRSAPVQLFNVLGFKDEMSDIELLEIEKFHNALDLYLGKEFEEAGKLFIEASRMNPDDKAALVFSERCRTYAKKGVDSDWDGVMNMTSK